MSYILLLCFAFSATCQFRFMVAMAKNIGARAVKHGGHATNELLVSFSLVATVMVIIS